MRFAAAALGWKIHLLDCVGSAAVAQLLGLDREADDAAAEREHPELVALVGQGEMGQIPESLPVQWDALFWRPRIHLGLFVQRVNDLLPGLYVLARDPEKVETLWKAMRPEFLWLRPQACPHGLPLYLLKEGDCRTLAATVSCGQHIAGDGAFSLGMIAE